MKTSTQTYQEPLILPEPEPEEATYIAEGERQDPFFYGYRCVEVKDNGTTAWIEQPLTLEDMLHPQLGDEIVQRKTHATICMDIYGVLGVLFDGVESIVVLHEVGIDWGIVDMRNHAPDIAVLEGVHTEPPGGIYNLPYTGGRPLVLMEVTSKGTRHLDVQSKNKKAATKFRHYAEAGVPVYIVIDDARCKQGQPPKIYGYALTPLGTYTELPHNAEGRIWIATIKVWIGTIGTRVALFDEHGNALKTHGEAVEAYQQELHARLLAEERAIREAEERKHAEERAIREAEERKHAEERAIREAEERKHAEERAIREAEERKHAEERAIREAEERKHAEEHVAHLEKRLRIQQEQQREQQKALARSMRAEGLDAALIAKFTGLTPDEIHAL